MSTKTDTTPKPVKLTNSHKLLLKAIARELGFCEVANRAITKAKTLDDVWDALDQHNTEFEHQIGNYSNRPPNVAGVLEFIHEESSLKDDLRILAALVKTRFGFADWSLADDMKLEALFQNWQEVKV